jgi:hypothetical protein
LSDASAAVKSALATLHFYMEKVDAQAITVKRDTRAAEDANAALTACLNGQSSSLRLEALVVSARAAADCGVQAKALGRVQGKASAYQRLQALLSGGHVGTVVTKLHAASATLRRLRATAAAHKGEAKLAAALAKLAASLDKEAAALGKIATTTRSFAASANAAAAKVPTAKAALAKCQATPPPPSLSISEDDTWAYNTAIGKGNICINVRTSPAQVSISATLSGPNGYQAKLNTTPLKTDGSIQIASPITVGGNYTKTLIVYDTTGKQTATVTKTFTVAAPPQDGPATTPPCTKPSQ